MRHIIKTKDERLKVKGILLSIFIFQFSICFAQEDELNRSVTVERDFQPVIQAAGKISTRPTFIETTIEPAPIQYSDYTAEVTPGTTFNALLSQPTRFDAARDYHGYVRGGLGHTNTLFDFGYHLDDGKKSILDVYAHHKAQWGLRADNKTNIGLVFTHPFSTCNLYFGIDGGNIYYHKYGHFYDYSLVNPSNWERNDVLYPKPRNITDNDITSLWTMEAFFGIKANAKQDFQYRIQTGYKLFSKPNAVSEHQIRTHASFDWHNEAHHVGMKAYIQNNFLQLSGVLATEIDPSYYNTRHNIRMEPYYEYNGKRVQLHVGVNLDMNIGKGKNSLSGVQNLSFAPSPNIHLEAQIAKQWLTFYTDITGRHGLGTLEDFMAGNHYRLIHAGIVSMHVASYVPVDAEIGFHIRPYRALLLELHGGYALMYNQRTLIADADNTSAHALGHTLHAGDFANTYSDFTRGKIGGQINYHYRDIVRVNIHGDYYFWSLLQNETTRYEFDNPCQALKDLKAGNNKQIYDRANWELGVRVDGRIDKHWSLYSDNYFAGSRLALATDGEHILRPTVELDLGVQYEMWLGNKSERRKVKGEKAFVNTSSNGNLVLRPEPKPNLIFFLQLNNFIHRKNDIYYGYRSQGINFLAGVTFRF